jgi:hypothetical protein
MPNPNSTLRPPHDITTPNYIRVRATNPQPVRLSVVEANLKTLNLKLFDFIQQCY